VVVGEAVGGVNATPYTLMSLHPPLWDRTWKSSSPRSLRSLRRFQTAHGN
jgi:hypothetical protein